MSYRNKLQLILLTIVFGSFFAVGVPAESRESNFSAADWRSGYSQKIMDTVNEKRLAAGLPKLLEDSAIQKAAQLKAEDMAKRGYFSHETPDGKAPWYWLKINGVGYAAAGENLAISFKDPGKIASAWMDSPLHKKNLMNGGYVKTGIGIAKGNFEGKETTFVVQIYVKPLERNKLPGLLP